jgi:hypothetical protein
MNVKPVVHFVNSLSALILLHYFRGDINRELLLMKTLGLTGRPDVCNKDGPRSDAAASSPGTLEPASLLDSRRLS